MVSDRLMRDEDRKQLQAVQQRAREQVKDSSLRVEVTAHRQAKPVVKVMVVQHRSMGDLTAEICRKMGAQIESLKLVDGGAPVACDEDVWYMPNGTKLHATLHKTH